MLRFDDRVAIVTGAGGGLGRAYAKLLAARGAKVLVNDLGTNTSGDAKEESAAELVVREIVQNSGEAIANRDSVADGERLVTQAMDHWGRVDIVINNAGFLRDIAFHNMTDDDWRDLYEVHLFGAYKVTRAAWPIMREQAYGRVINTASAAGIYGSFGQANYSAFKLGCHGMTQSLALEGKSKNICVNTIAPAADSRLTRTVMSAEMLAPMKPELVSPLVAFLCHDSTTETGGLYEVGGGWIGKLRWERSPGAYVSGPEGHSPEQLAEHWSAVTGFENATHPTNMQEATEPFAAIMNPGREKSA